MVQQIKSCSSIEPAEPEVQEGINFRSTQVPVIKYNTGNNE